MRQSRKAASGNKRSQEGKQNEGAPKRRRLSTEKKVVEGNGKSSGFTVSRAPHPDYS